jgi:DNA-binding transcriptional regulator YbjK
VVRRKPNPQQRRRDVCDAAIELLAGQGARGLSHLKVDRAAGLPDGTTSFYYRTRSALLHAVAARLTELDVADLASIAAADPPPDGSPSLLAQAIVSTVFEPRLTRTKARYEVLLQATRDPELVQQVEHSTALFMELSRAVIMQMQPDDIAPDAELIDDQTYAAMTFINGALIGIACGDRRIHSAEQLDALLAGIVAGVAHTRAAGVSAGTPATASRST